MFREAINFFRPRITVSEILLQQLVYLQKTNIKLASF